MHITATYVGCRIRAYAPYCETAAKPPQEQTDELGDEVEGEGDVHPRSICPRGEERDPEWIEIRDQEGRFPKGLESARRVVLRAELVGAADRALPLALDEDHAHDVQEGNQPGDDAGDERVQHAATTGRPKDAAPLGLCTVGPWRGY